MSNQSIINMLNTARAYSNKQERNNALTQYRRQMTMQKQAQSFNSKEAKINRQFQLNMSNTAHQREILDLQKAGINPILSANNGASTTSGAQATSGEGSVSKADTDMQKAGLLMNWLMNKQNNAQQLKINKMNNANALKLAQISAAASMYGANQSLAGSIASASATRYASNNSLAGMLAGANATRIAAALSAEATKYGANQSYESTKYSQDSQTKRTRLQILSDSHNKTLDRLTTKRGQNYGLASSVLGASSSLINAGANAYGTYKKYE